MSSFLSHHITRLGQMRPLGAILHLGAGRGTEVQNWLTAGARRIVLQEPNPTFHSLLQPLCARDPRLRLLTSASSAQNSSATFYQLNAAEHSSLKAPDGLQNILPGLRTLQRHTVPCVSLSKLLENLPLEPGFCHILIIDTPGVEHDIISQLASLPVQKKFERLFLRAPQQPLYQGSLGAQSLLEALARDGYDIAAQSTETSDFGLYHLKSHALSGTARTEAEVIKTLQLTLSQVLKDCQILRSDLQSLQSSHKTLVKERDQMVQRLDDLKATLAKIQGEAPIVADTPDNQ